jgi:hypothetical protein
MLNTSSAKEVGYEGGPEKPNKVQLSNHPKVCDCKKCNMDYCDCSEEQQGAVPHSDEYWQAKK